MTFSLYFCIIKHMINIYLEKIKELRLGKGKTQEDMAKIIGVSRPTYAAIETGRQKLDIEQAFAYQSLLQHM